MRSFSIDFNLREFEKGWQEAWGGEDLKVSKY